MTAAFFFLIGLSSAAAKIGKISLLAQPVRELNPGPCTGFPITPEGAGPHCCYEEQGYPSPGTCENSPGHTGVPCCCPGAYGPQCKACTGTSVVDPPPGGGNPYPLICNGNGICDGSSTGLSAGTGECFCEVGHNGEACNEIGTPSYPDKLFPPLTSAFLSKTYAFTVEMPDATSS